ASIPAGSASYPPTFCGPCSPPCPWPAKEENARQLLASLGKRLMIHVLSPACVCGSSRAVGPGRPSVARPRGVLGQGHEGEIMRIHVVLQVEHFGKSCAGELLLMPVALGLLGCEQEIDPRLHDLTMGLVCCHQT